MRNKTAWISLLLALTLVVSACSGSKGAKTEESPKASDTPAAQSGSKVLTIGMWSAPDSFNAITNKTSYGTQVISLIYPSLYAMTPSLGFEPRLAESYTMNDAQTEFTFKLHKDAKWTDGQPITAEDVAYTFQVIAHPDTPTSRRSLIDTIKGLTAEGTSETKDFNVSGIQVIDATTIKFTTKKPVDKDSFMEKVASGIYIMPKHVIEPAVKANLKGFDKADITMKPTVFGGPYKFVNYSTDQYIELAANESYFLGKPKIEKVFYKIVGQATFAAALEKGEIDVAAGVGISEVPITDWEKVSKLPNLKPVTYVAPAYYYLDFNVALPEFSNAKIREAFAHAINRPLIVQRLLKGQGEVLNTPVNSANKYYVKSLQTQLEYDPTKAKKMLQDNGWDFSKEVTILTPTGNVVREQSADIIMANLQEVGVKVKIEKVDFATRQSRSKDGKFQLSLAGISASFDPDFSILAATTGAYNDRKYSSAKMDDLLAKGKEIVKFDEKKAHYDLLQQYFINELPYLPLYSTNSLCAVNTRVVNVQPSPVGLNWNAHLWDVK